MSRIAVVQSLISSELAVPLDSANILNVCTSAGHSASFFDLNFGDKVIGNFDLIYLSTYTVVPYNRKLDFPLVKKSVLHLVQKGIKIVVGTYWMSDSEIQEIRALGVSQVLKGDTVQLFQAALNVTGFNVPDFSLIPLARYKKSLFSQKKNSVPVAFSRGCDLDCTYCPVESSLQRMSLLEIEKYIQNIVERSQVEHLMIEDDLFNSSPEFVKDFCDLMNQKFPWITWELLNGLHPGLMTQSAWEAIANSQCLHLALGLECLDFEYLEKRNRKYDFNKTMKAVRLLASKGVATSGYLLFDFILDSKKEFREQISLLRSSPLTLIHFSSIRDLGVFEKILRSITMIYIYTFPERFFLLYNFHYIRLETLKRAFNKILRT